MNSPRFKSRYLLRGKRITKFLLVRDPILLFATLVSLVFLCAGLSTESTNELVWGKNLRIWIGIIVSLVGALAFGLSAYFFGSLARFCKRGILLGLIAVVLFETIGFVFPKTIPIGMLVMTPKWVQDVLPRDAFDRSNFRIGRTTEIRNHPTLAYLYMPNLDVPVLDFEISFHRRYDKYGFANNDDTLYENADVVVTGDSFTMADTVELEDAWPRILSDKTGARVLNLAAAGWHTYQYSAVLDEYSLDVDPEVILVTLTGMNDTWATYNNYEDYRSTGGVLGWTEFSKRGKSKGSWSELPSTALTPARYTYELTRKFAPFTSTAMEYITAPNPQICHFTISGERISYGFSWSNFYRPGYTSPKWSNGKLGESELERIGQHLNRIVEFGEKVGAEVRFIYLPFPEEIYIPVLEYSSEMSQCAQSLLDQYHSGDLQLDRFRIQYEQALGNNRDLLLDVTPYLQDAVKGGENLAWVFDTHPNKLGHQRIAEFVAASIAELASK